MAAVLRGCVVPLLGAGASRDSVETTEELRKCLVNSISEPFDKISTSGIGDFSRLAEIVYWHFDELGLCEILGIEKWAECPPTRAHRYIALLACDGLITEVITTNYDCGLEKAYRAARGLADGEWPDGEWHAIACEDNLRRPGHKDGHELLRLYKINGCARRLKDAKTDQDKKLRAEEILLTERQLQKFGNRRWAADVFRVVLRSRQLILSGFGSEEPQIWHVVTDILREFELKSTTLSGRFLWAALHEDAISFPILQALMGENRVRRRNAMPPQFDNLFFPTSEGFFSGPSNQGHLDAGDFWRKVWIEALRSRLCDCDGPVGRAFFYRITGGPYRPHRYGDNVWRALWIKIVDHAFDQMGGQWLAEPRRHGTETSQWAKEDNEPPRRDAPCAPERACVQMPGGRTRYVSPNQEPDYWIALLLLMLAFADTELEGSFAGIDPVISVGLGRGRLHVGRASRSGLTVSTRRARDGMVTLEILAPLLRDLGNAQDKLKPEDTVIAAFVRDRLRDAIHSARHLEISTREDRRERG